jgi:Flp pilus assembly pilin Flp
VARAIFFLIRDQNREVVSCTSVRRDASSNGAASRDQPLARRRGVLRLQRPARGPSPARVWAAQPWTADEGLTQGQASTVDPFGSEWYARPGVDTRGRAAVKSRFFRRIRFARDTRGVVMVEYAVLIGIVGISCATAFVALGVAFVNSFGFVRGMLLVPFP